MPGPLEGYRILDFTRFQQGPYATVMLADLGAEVWKVEPPGGDPGRRLDRAEDGFSRYFEAHDRGKKSIALDLREEAGRAIALRLAQAADVVIENYRPGVMDRLGLGYAALSERNPRIVLVSASAFGPEGPLAGRPGYDVIGQAMGGVMTLQSHGAGEEPITLPGGFADQVGAMQACVATLSALLARERSGAGQHVEVSLLGSQIALQAVYLTGFLRDGAQPYQRRRRTPTFTFYEAADGRWLVIGVIDERNWQALCGVIERENLLDDRRFRDGRLRLENAAALEPILEAAFREEPRAIWLEKLTEADIPAAPVNDYADVAAEPQVWENGYLARVPHPAFGELTVPGVPWRFSRTPASVSGVAPDLDANREEILGEAGIEST